jgi:hypothetical protein
VIFVGHGHGIRRFAASFPGVLIAWATAIFVGDGLANFWDFVSWWVGCVVRYTYIFGGGVTRIARVVPWAGSITGGEACGYPCSEKEGFTHPPLWRAPCFWGTHEWELHAVDTYEPAF